MSLNGHTIALRLACPDEAPTVRLLAELDEAPAPEGQVLLALVDGDAVAALSLDDGASVANPFVATADAIALLRLRAEHLARGHRKAHTQSRHTIRRARY